MSLFYNDFQHELDEHYPYYNAASFSLIYKYSHRLQIQEICEILSKEINSKELLLDAGCGYGAYSILLSNHIRYIGLDISSTAIYNAKKWMDEKVILKNFDFIIGDIHYLPFKDMTFDIVLCLEVLEHLNNIKIGLKELHRVIKRIGLFSIPNSLSLYYIIQRVIPVVTPKEENPHLNYNFHNIKKIITNLGFDVISIRSNLIIPIIPFPFLYEYIVKIMRLLESNLNKTFLRNFGAHYMMMVKTRARDMI